MNIFLIIFHILMHFQQSRTVNF